MKKLISLLLLAALALSLAACGGEAAPDPNAGVYEAVSAEMWGLTVDVADVFEEGFSLELLNGGKAKFHYEGKSYNLKWTLEDGAFHAEGGGAELDGTLSGGTLVLENLLDSGMSITLVNRDYAPAGAEGGA